MATESLPFVSVIIPCYKQAHYLGEAIESVLNQTYPHFEIIVVDDGSPDNASEVAARYSRVRCVRQENQGLSAARNTGIRESTGRYLVFLDADDRLLPRALEIGVESFSRHPECGFVSGFCDIIAADGSPLPPHASQSVIDEDPYITLLRSCPIYPLAAMHRRDVVSSLNCFDLSNGPAADYDLYYRTAREFPIHCHGNVVGEYRRHDDNMTGDAGRMLKANVSALRSQWRYVRRNPKHRRAYKEGIRFWQQMYGEAVAHEVRTHIKKREWEQAARRLRLLLRYYPRAVADHAGRKIKKVFFGDRGRGPSGDEVEI